MPRIGVSITKSVPFRNSVQEFSNVYYFEVSNLPTVAESDTTIDNLTSAEKTFHGTGVTFVRGRLWSQLGSQSQNEMISQKNLSGTGARSPQTSMDKERAFLFRLRAGVDSRGQPVYLRKWFHACAEFVAGASVPLNVLTNSSNFTTAERTAQVNAMNSIGNANGSPNLPRICSKNGRLPGAGNTWEAHAFLEHHQMGDMWRAT